MSFTQFHGITMAENSFVENLVIESLSTDPAAVEAGRIWFNTSEKQYKATSLDASAAVVIRVLGGKEQLDAYILDLESQVRGEGSALVGYAGKTGANSKFSLAAGTAEESFDSVVTGIDANAQALSDLGTGTLTDIQNELDATQTGAGLSADGTYVVNSTANYINTAATINAATVELDTQAKANADAIAQEGIDRQTADNLKVDKAGDSMTGVLAMSGNKVTGLGNPTDDYDAANKLYVDTAINGVDWKDSAKAAASSDVTLSGEQTIDGVALVTGDRVLVKGQTDATENGIYVVDSSAWTRSADADNNPGGEVTTGLAVFVEEGTLSGSNGFVLTTPDPITLGTTALSFSQFSGAGQVIAGAGIVKNGNELSLLFGAGIAELPNDEIGVEVDAAGGLFTTSDGTTADTSTGATLSVKLDGTTLTKSINGLKITDSVLSGINDSTALVQNELDATQTGAGLEADGSYTANTNANYINAAASLKAADTALDAQVKVNTDGLAQEGSDRTAADTAIQAEMDATQIGAGLEADGSYTQDTSANYIASVTNLRSADIALDTQAKVNADGLAQEITDRINAISGVKDAVNANTFTFESSTPATSHTVNHNLNNAFVTVAMWVKHSDGTWQNDIAQITLTNNSSLTVDLTVAKDIRVVVTAPTDI